MSRSRSVTIAQGDDLRAIASRELGDTSRWPEIARLNDLRLPYILATWRPEDRLEHTRIWGDSILVPWKSNIPLPPTATSVLGKDMALPHGLLQVTADGDFGTLSGVENAIQALGLRLKTLLSEITYHPRYGCNVSLALGLPAGPFASLMASAWVSESLRAEPRIAQIHYVKTQVSGDTIRVAASMTLDRENGATDLNLVLNP